MKRKAVIAAAFSLLAGPAWATIITVGPSGQFSTISAAVTAAAAGDDIQVAAGTYTNDFPTVTQPLTIEAAVPGSAVVLQATVPPPNDKGIIVTTSSLTVRGLTIEGAAISDALGGNAAGIRDQSTGAGSLVVENSTFRNNQNGILTSGSGNQETVQVIGSSFIDNGSGTGQTHALYVGDALSLLVSNSVFCGTLEGHDIKSRATSTTVTGSTVFDGATGAGCGSAGTTSIAIEAPNGGAVQIVDTEIVQGAATHNTTMVSYGFEGLPYADNSLVISDTSFTSSGVNAVGIQAAGTAAAGACQLAASTTFSGVNTEVSPASFCVAAPASPGGPVVAVAEPGGVALLASSLLILTVWRRRRGSG